MAGFKVTTEVVPDATLLRISEMITADFGKETRLHLYTTFPLILDLMDRFSRLGFTYLPLLGG